MPSRLPPGVRTDLPVLVTFTACVVTVQSPTLHLVAGLLLLAATGLHLATRRWPRRFRPVRLVHAVLLLAAAGTAVTGLLRWAGLPPSATWHGAWSWAALTVLVLHVAVMWRVVLARHVRTGRPPRPPEQRSSEPAGGRSSGGDERRTPPHDSPTTTGRPTARPGDADRRPSARPTTARRAGQRADAGGDHVEQRL